MIDIVNLRIPSLENTKENKIEQITSNNNNTFDKTIKEKLKTVNKQEDKVEKPNVVDKLNKVIEKTKAKVDEVEVPEIKEELESLTEDLVMLVELISQILSTNDDNTSLELNFLDADSSIDELLGVNSLDINLNSNSILKIEDMSDKLMTITQSINKFLESSDVIKYMETSDLVALDTEINSLINMLDKVDNKLDIKDIKDLLINKSNNQVEEIKVNEAKITEVKVEEANYSFEDTNDESNLSGESLDSKVELNEEKSDDEVLSKILGEDKFSSKLESVTERLSIKNLDTSLQAKALTKFTVADDMITNVKFMVKNTLTELSVKVYPKELGEVTIKLLSEDGIMRADIKSVSKETYHLLNSNIHEIKKSLELQGIKIQSVDIGLYSEDTTYFSNEQNFNREAYEEQQNLYNVNSNSSEEELEIDDINEQNSDSNLDYLV